MKKFIVPLIFLTFNILRVDSIKCYQCTSLNNTGCADPFDAKNTLAECPDLGTREAILCRKLRQTVDTPHGKIVRVTRSCGYIPNTIKERDDGCFRASFTAQSASRYCACMNDECNSSYSMHGISMIVSVIAAVLICLII
ncbi:UPAR/Ly6 domain-containing protein crok-like [Chironomus tepperi]|uniref:UPAR/Ly6 domain-containing protein crok-like n=1 Tax=Chironomus tepperi TaxID=113505 RepID=UPI00391F4987